MKIVVSKFLVVVLFLFSAVVSAQPPCPSNDCPPGPPDVPINDSLMVLLVIGLLFGLRIIYRYKNKKASI